MLASVAPVLKSLCPSAASFKDPGPTRTRRWRWSGSRSQGAWRQSAWCHDISRASGGSSGGSSSGPSSVLFRADLRKKSATFRSYAIRAWYLSSALPVMLDRSGRRWVWAVHEVLWWNTALRHGPDNDLQVLDFYQNSSCKPDRYSLSWSLCLADPCRIFSSPRRRFFRSTALLNNGWLFRRVDRGWNSWSKSMWDLRFDRKSVMARQIAEGLSFLHDQNVVTRLQSSLGAVRLTSSLFLPPHVSRFSCSSILWTDMQGSTAVGSASCSCTQEACKKVPVTSARWSDPCENVWTNLGASGSKNCKRHSWWWPEPQLHPAPLCCVIAMHSPDFAKTKGLEASRPFYWA